jgi:uncharacterized protein (DUF2062 family)
MDISQLWDPLLKPMTIGAIPLGMVFAVAGYFLTRWAVATFHARRQARLAAKNRRLADAGRSGFAVTP